LRIKNILFYFIKEKKRKKLLKNKHKIEIFIRDDKYILALLLLKIRVEKGA